MANKLHKKLRWLFWMARYWALWKYRTYARIAAFCVSGLALVAGFLHETVSVIVPGQPRQAFVWMYYLAVLIISMIIAYATAPKGTTAEKQTGTAPESKDGAGVKRVYGEVWIDDSNMLGWQQAGTEAIKSDGGKK
jgi:hypothetical protein